jgi:hypothetical protein
MGVLARVLMSWISWAALRPAVIASFLCKPIRSSNNNNEHHNMPQNPFVPAPSFLPFMVVKGCCLVCKGLVAVLQVCALLLTNSCAHSAQRSVRALHFVRQGGNCVPHVHQCSSNGCCSIPWHAYCGVQMKKCSYGESAVLVGALQAMILPAIAVTANVLLHRNNCLGTCFNEHSAFLLCV